MYSPCLGSYLVVKTALLLRSIYHPVKVPSIRNTRLHLNKRKIPLPGG